MSNVAFRKWRILLLAGSVSVTLLLVEGSLRILGLPEEHRSKRAESQLFAAVSGAAYLYVNYPAKALKFFYDSNPGGYLAADNSVTHHTNANGFRGPEFSLRKLPGTVRILFVGDSCTFGEGVEDGDTYPERFRDFVQESDAFRGRKVEVINLGVGGYNAEQQHYLLRDFGIQLEPDWIVVGFSLNDAEPPLFYRDQEGLLNRRDRESEIAEYRGSPNIPGPFRGLHITRLAYLAVEKRLSSARTVRHYQGLYGEGSDGKRRVTKALAEIARLGRERGIPVTIVIFPVLFRLHDYPFRSIHGAVQDIAAREGLDVVDLLPTYRGFSGPDLWVHPSDQHPNQVAHRLAAFRLWEFLQSPDGASVRITPELRQPSARDSGRTVKWP